MPSKEGQEDDDIQGDLFTLSSQRYIPTWHCSKSMHLTNFFQRNQLSALKDMSTESKTVSN